jgi:hypothetical protein
MDKVIKVLDDKTQEKSQELREFEMKYGQKTSKAQAKPSTEEPEKQEAKGGILA